MDRQSPSAPSLVVAAVATLVWALVLAVAPLPRALVALGMMALVVVAVAQFVPARLLPSPFRWGAALLGLVVGVGTLALTHLIAPTLFALVPTWSDELVALQRGAIQQSPFAGWLGLVVVVVVVVAEELLWRGLALSALRARTHEAVAIVAAAALYAMGQLGFGLTLPVAAALALGLVWGLLRIVTGGLVASTVAHAVWTLGVVWAWPLLPTT